MELHGDFTMYGRSIGEIPIEAGVLETRTKESDDQSVCLPPSLPPFHHTVTSEMGRTAGWWLQEVPSLQVTSGTSDAKGKWKTEMFAKYITSVFLESKKFAADKFFRFLGFSCIF